MKLLLVLAFMLIIERAPAAQFYSGGEPGCFAAIHGVAMDEATVKLLPSKCQNLRALYLKTITELSKPNQTVTAQIKKAIKDAKGAKAPYDAILFASLMNDNSMVVELEKRAKLEEKLKLNYQYAASALEKSKNGMCGKNFNSNFYKEICEMNDPVMKRVIALRHSLDGAK